MALIFSIASETLCEEFNNLSVNGRVSYKGRPTTRQAGSHPAISTGGWLHRYIRSGISRKSSLFFCSLQPHTHAHTRKQRLTATSMTLFCSWALSCADHCSLNLGVIIRGEQFSKCHGCLHGAASTLHSGWIHLHVCLEAGQLWSSHLDCFFVLDCMGHHCWQGWMVAHRQKDFLSHPLGTLMDVQVSRTTRVFSVKRQNRC